MNRIIFLGWLTKAPPNTENKQAYCKLCSAYLAAQRKNLTEHMQTAKHNAAVQRDQDAVTVQKIDKFVKPKFTESKKVAQLKLAYFTAEHTSTHTLLL